VCVRALVPARCLTMTAQLSNGDGLRKVPQNEGGDDDSIAEQKARPWVRARRWPKAWHRQIKARSRSGFGECSHCAAVMPWHGDGVDLGQRASLDGRARWTQASGWARVRE
jgi:hypothetical protein